MPSLTPDLVEQAARVAPDHTLATSFLEADQRQRVISLILFAHEIARARANVSEPGLAAIRLQWWRDVIEQIYSGVVVRAQPIAVALAQTVREAALPRLFFDAMIDAHEAELLATPFSSWADLEAYLDATHGNLARLSALACGLGAITTPLNEAAKQSALAWGLARLIVNTPQWCTRRASWLPEAVATSLDKEALYAGDVSAGLIGVFRTILKRISAAHKAANLALSRAKLDGSFPVVAHAALALPYAKGYLPDQKRGWSGPREVTLLKRQIIITLAVARQRI
jgi:15-cis-phytoene synthase